jgi:hypothetical protein
MHLNKLSTAALMRLSILASFNLLLGRFVGYWSLFHPLFFLIVVTLDLGLYAVMVYSGTLNRTLIAMMLAGLGGVLLVVAYGGSDASAFVYGGPYRGLAEWAEQMVNAATRIFPKAGFRPPPKQFWWIHGTEVAHVIVDAMGLAAIIASGFLARVLQSSSTRSEPPAVLPSS